MLAKEKLEEIEMNYQQVRERYMVPLCQKCETKKLNYTWSKLDFVSMAHAAGSIGALIVPGYYIPMREAHSTPGAIISRLKESEDGGIEFDEGPQRDKADDALSMAHTLVLNVIDLQKEHFKMHILEALLETCVNDFKEIWTTVQKKEM